ncbi:lysosome membrane protein 2-like [Engraulis encrasicolus]|uniref:lysosome membrane protein 2-like n=1 Tax=Engraulis encrasicolus TaxID=184585 RepID=UPI002FD6D39B
MMRMPCCVYATGIIAALLLISGIALMIADVFPHLIAMKLKGEFTLTEGSKVFDSWKNPPPPVFMEFFFYNVTNSEEFLAGQEKARVVEVGPYTYREYRPKANVSFPEDGKVAAYTPKSFVFLPEKSVGDPDLDLITTVSVPAVAVMDKTKDSMFRAPMANVWMKSTGSGLFTTRTVNELLWGYPDPLLAKAAAFQKGLATTFGFMLDKNNTDDGEFVYYTGEADYMEYGRVHTWKGESKLSYWGSNYTNAIRGSDGSAFHPYLSKEERLHVFTPDLCRSIYMEFEQDVEVKGIPAYRFTPPRSVLASAAENPDNEGFCMEKVKEKCLGSGVLKVAVCKKDVPVVVSFPHFYLGDEKYHQDIDGVSPPVREEHQTYVDLNPTTGILVRASKRAQFNIVLEKLNRFAITKNLNTTVFPMFFLNETVVIDDVSAARVTKLLTIAHVASNFYILIIGLGGLLAIILLVYIILARRRTTTARDETTYSPVSAKIEDYSDNSKNGNYVGMTPVITERS